MSRRRIWIGLAFCVFVMASACWSLSRYASLYDAPPRTATFFDREGRFLGTLHPLAGGFQIWTPLEGIPERVTAETLRREDRHFYRHPGVNPWAVLKAAVENLRRGRIVRGGSTITQQLAKNLIQEREGGVLPRGWFNKVRSTALALGLELRHSKDWILERYLNTAYYGNRCYGAAAAARAYFGKELSQLNAGEISRLAALPKAPGRAPRLSAEAFPAFVGRHMAEYLAPGRSGAVFTTLDVSLQGELERKLDEFLSLRAETDPLLDAAVVVIGTASGDVLAMVGSRDYSDAVSGGQYNAAVALRQPGSALKPFTYFAAFARGYTPDSWVADIPANFAAAPEDDAYAPQNFDRRFRGYVTVREALANSYNVPPVAVLDDIGLSYYHEVLKAFGFTTLKKPPRHYGLAVTLGSGEVTLLELTNAYATLARGGSFLPYRLTAGEPAASPREVLPEASRHASEITRILADPENRLKTFGYNESLRVDGRQVAVKTGTSYELRDNWTVGYTPVYAAGVWVGHADASPLPGTTGASGAAPVWHVVMETLLRDAPAEAFTLAPPLPGASRRILRTASAHAREPGLKILSPLPGERYRFHPALPRERQKILAEVQMDKNSSLPPDWTLDGETPDGVAGKGPDGAWRLWLKPSPGWHTLAVGGRRVKFHVAAADEE